MNQLKLFLDEASKAYYAGSPFIADEVFDRLAETSNYDKVGAKQHDNKEEHYYPLYSLQKFYEDEGAEPLREHKNKVASIKLDGAAISLLYVGGKLVKALTRGDGTKGVVITAKMLGTKLVPHTIDYAGVLQVTGEIAAPSHIENARNYAAGALNLGSTEEFKSRAVSFFAYGMYPTLNEYYTEDMMWLSQQGFGTILESDLEKVYPSDGMVFRIDSNETFLSLGYTSLFPRGAYAKKIRSKAVETTLLAVEWQVGKSGKVTPVAILEPVYCGDALVSRATLNNPGFIQALDLQIGDRVAVERAGEIIPCITHKVE